MTGRGAWVACAVALLAGCRQQQAEVKPDSGQTIYTTRCALCHGREGEGAPGMYPPLVGSDWVNGPPERLAAIILDGMRGPVGHYNGVMPGWRTVLEDAQIAAVMTWLRRADAQPPVTPVEVHQVRLETEVRHDFWTVSDLQSLRIH